RSVAKGAAAVKEGSLCGNATFPGRARARARVRRSCVRAFAALRADCCALMPVTRAAGGARVTGSEAPHEDTGTYRLMAREAAHLRSVGAWFVRRWPNTEPVAASSLALVAMAANPPQRRAASTTPYSCSYSTIEPHRVYRRPGYSRGASMGLSSL